MKIETITVTNMGNGRSMDVKVMSKDADKISIIFGKGANDVRCDLTPTRDGQAYAGRVLGREFVFSRSRAQVQADLNHDDPIR